jgi:ABC-type lipoprotein release transport system permease subunit
VPEIHAVVGTSPEDAVLLRGIQLEAYTRLEEFKIIAGRPLGPGDPPRLAMVGARLADERQVMPGGPIELRGRQFSVVGVFSTGTYADNEAWVSLADAQTLLGWGSDVSIFIIPDGESYHEGDSLPGGISVVRKGETGSVLNREWTPLLNLLALVITALGVAAAIALANILWRLAWLRRRDLAILQSVGFGKLAQAGYLFIQGLGITVLGLALGVAEALAVGGFNRLNAAGVIIRPLYDARIIAVSLVFTACLTLAGTALPAWRLSRKNLVMMMRAE